MIFERIWEQQFMSDGEAIALGQNLIKNYRNPPEDRSTIQQRWDNFTEELNKIIPDDSPTGRFTFIPITAVIKLFNNCFGPGGWKFFECSRTIDNYFGMDLMYTIRGALVIPSINVLTIDEGNASMLENAIADGFPQVTLQHEDFRDALNTDPNGIAILFKAARADCIKRNAIQIGVGSQFLEDPLAKLPKSQRTKDKGSQKPDKPKEPSPPTMSKDDNKVLEARRAVAEIEISRIIKVLNFTPREAKEIAREVLSIPEGTPVVRSRLSVQQLEKFIAALKEREEKAAQASIS